MGLTNQIINYDFIDIITGKGIIELYGSDYRTGTTQTYILTTKPFYAQQGFVAYAAASAVDQDFDIKLQRPLILDGDMYVGIPMIVDGTGNDSVIMTCLLRKWDGTTETEIVSDTQTRTPLPGGLFNMWMFKLSIPRTGYKSGETIRVTVQVTVPTGKIYTIFWDPKNRSKINGTINTAETTQLIVQLPVVANI